MGKTSTVEGAGSLVVASAAKALGAKSDGETASATGRLIVDFRKARREGEGLFSFMVVDLL